MAATNSQDSQDKRPLLFIGNRWVNTIYSNYGVIKQRILLQIIEALQNDIKKVMRGKRVSDYNIPSGQDVYLHLDMSKIVHYNNYHWVRKAVKEMSMQSIQIYNDPTFKSEIYLRDTLLNGFELTKEKKVIALRLKKGIAELLLHVDFSRTKNRALQYTKFDPFTVTHSSSKYMYPLYTMICSYAEKGGFTIGIDELRTRLQVEEKYRGFDNFHRFVLKHIQKELQIFGSYGYNFTLVKTGKVVKKIVFKIFANKKYDHNHVWLRIQRALNDELPYYARFTPEQREQTNYLLTGKFDLDQVLTKLQHIHKALVKRKDQGDQVRNAFAYFIRSLHEQFPPG
jgi:plasmid replication initiation protein